MSSNPSGISAYDSENSSDSDWGSMTRYIAKAITYPTGHWHLVRQKLYAINTKHQSVTGMEIKDILILPTAIQRRMLNGIQYCLWVDVYPMSVLWEVCCIMMAI